jgi:hypothetical protein
MHEYCTFLHIEYIVLCYKPLVCHIPLKTLICCHDAGDPEHGIQEGEAQLMMGRMLHVLQDLTQFVSRISDLVKHTVQQLASLYSPEGCVILGWYGCTFWYNVELFALQDIACDQLPWNSPAGNCVVMGGRHVKMC